MNTMIERVAKAIQEATDKPKYTVRIGKQWELWEGDTRIVESSNHSHIDDLCDKLNSQYIARKAIETLKGEITSDVFFRYRCDKPWKDLTSTEVWNLWIDAILKE